ncbi:MAG: MMPL family transporter [Thermoleophilia bacterium]
MQHDEDRRGGVAAGLSRAIVALRHVVILGWIAAAVAAVVYLPPLAGSGELDLPLPADAAPLEAEARSAAIFGAPLTARTQVLVTRPGGLSAAEQVALADFAVQVGRGRVPGLEEVAAAVPLPSAGGVAPGARDGGPASVLTYLLFREQRSIARQVELGEAYIAAAPVPAGAAATLTGSSAARDAQMATISDRLPWVVLVTLALIVLVVGAVMGSPVAPLVVLATVGVAYVIDLRLIGWIGEGTDITASQDIEPVVSALLIGIVTDYALFYLFRTRARLRAGDDPRRATAAAGAHLLGIVTVAGLTVALGTATLLVGDIDFFRAFAPSLVVTALLAALVSVTLVPALLAVLGRGAFWPRGPGAPRETEPGHRAPLAARLLTTRAVAAVTALVVMAGLGACAGQHRHLEMGLGLTSGLAPGADVTDAGFAAGVTAPTEVLVQGPGATDPAVLARLGDALRAAPGVADVVGPADPLPSLAPGLATSPEAGASRFAVILEDPPTESAAIADLDRIATALPAMLAAAGAPGATASLAGDTAIARASIDAMGTELLRVGLAALVVNLLLLAVFLRALVAPLYLLAANALTVAATLGLATWFFQDLLGQGQLVYYVPFATAVLLLALGSDYTIFLVGGIWRAAQRLGIREGIRTAMPPASATITVAGLILAGSFGLLALVPVDALHQFAFVMGVGVALDAFVVRPLLLPALITVFGRGGFWPGGRPAPAPEGAVEA